MQSSLEFFCEECGAANPGDATHCFACKEPLSHSPASLPAPVRVQPVVVTPLPTLLVTADAALSQAPAFAEISDVLPPGVLLQGRYRIREEIGRGGYSIVYKARDTARHSRQVSIKQINLRNLTSRQVIEATETFNRETTLLPVLQHEGIPKFYGSFTDAEHWYLIMEYIPGQTLEDYLRTSTKSGRCTLSETLWIGIQLSHILEYLHVCKPSLIFRDVKPANVMLTPRKKLYLIDFGIARTFNSSKSKDTTPLGSPGYAAPEQYGRGQSDGRTDIYGLGMTLQTLLTGLDPLDSQADGNLQPAQLVPAYVQKLLSEMTDHDSNRRPRNMAVVRQRLQIVEARVKRRALCLLGAGLGLVLYLWSYLNVLVSGSQQFFDSPLRLLLVGSQCLWALSTFFLAITLFVFLFNRVKRSITLGAIAVVLLVSLLNILGIIHIF